MIRIAYDLDEVLFESYELWKMIVEKDGYEIIEKGYFQMVTDPPMDTKTIMKYFGKVFMRWHDMEPVKDAKEVLQYQYSVTGEPIYIITNRPEQYATETIKLIKRLKVPFMLTMTQNSDTKWEYLESYDYFVEDRRRTARIVSAMGTSVFLMDKPYNQLNVKTPPKSVSDRVLAQLLNTGGDFDIYPISGLKEVLPFLKS